MVAGFSFQGTELIGVAAGEAEDPEKNVPKAINSIFWRILLLSLIHILQTFVKNLIDQQPQISKALQDAITTVIGSHRDMVLFDFNQESIDTTFVDESLIDDAPVVAPPMPLPPVVEEKAQQDEFYTCLLYTSLLRY